jgi:hypothetical protein
MTHVGVLGGPRVLASLTHNTLQPSPGIMHHSVGRSAKADRAAAVMHDAAAAMMRMRGGERPVARHEPSAAA